MMSFEHALNVGQNGNFAYIDNVILMINVVDVMMYHKDVENFDANNDDDSS